MKYSSLKEKLNSQTLVSLNKLQTILSLSKRDILLHLILLSEKPQIYTAKREWKRKEDTQITDEVFLLKEDAEKIFNLTL